MTCAIALNRGQSVFSPERLLEQKRGLSYLTVRALFYKSDKNSSFILQIPHYMRLLTIASKAGNFSVLGGDDRVKVAF